MTDEQVEAVAVAIQGFDDPTLAWGNVNFVARQQYLGRAIEAIKAYEAAKRKRGKALARKVFAP